MSSDDLHSSNGRPEIVDIELDIRLLGSLVEESEDIPADDSELLARLDAAVTMAGGVEARLDEILGQLDDLLTSLEIKDSDEPQQVTIPRSESQSERPPSEQSRDSFFILFDRAEAGQLRQLWMQFLT